MKHKPVSRLVVRVFQVILYAFIRALHATYRIREIGSEHLTAAQAMGPKGSYLLACWHETVLSMSISQEGRNYCTITSRSNVGSAVAYLMRKFGFVAIQGSQSSGGQDVRVKALDHIKRGFPIAITVDGSSGPRRKVKPGIVDLAKKSGAPILPAYAHSDKTWVFNSWDRFRLPRPFARITILFGEPIPVSPEAKGVEFNSLLEQVELSINALESLATSRSSESNPAWDVAETHTASAT